MSVGVRHILITGPPGVGKTTLIKTIVQGVKKKHVRCVGFYTEEVRGENGVRTGFDVITIKNYERFPLARISDGLSAPSGPSVGRYVVNVSSFESAIRPVFDEKLEKPTVLVIDEIGKMESFSAYFLKVVSRLLKNSPNCLILATIPVYNQLPVVKEIVRSSDTELFTVNIGNRNHLVDLLATSVVHWYSSVKKL